MSSWSDECTCGSHCACDCKCEFDENGKNENPKEYDHFYSIYDIISPPPFKNLNKLWKYLNTIKNKDDNKKIIECELTDEGETMFEKAFLLCYVQKFVMLSSQEESEELQIDLEVETKFKINGVDRFCFNVVSIMNGEYEKEKSFELDYWCVDTTICKICFKDETNCDCGLSNNGTCSLCNKNLPTEPEKLKCEHRFHTCCLLKCLKRQDKVECPVCKTCF